MSFQSFPALEPPDALAAAPNPVARQVLSKDEWDRLKPVIQRLYIDENLPRPRVAAILRESYGFAPTKRQFDRRIEEWGFKKNASQKERHTILSSGKNAVGKHGKKSHTGYN